MKTQDRKKHRIVTTDTRPELKDKMRRCSEYLMHKNAEAYRKLATR